MELKVNYSSFNNFEGDFVSLDLFNLIREIMINFSIKIFYRETGV